MNRKMKLVFQKKIAMKRKIYLFALLGLFLAATACQDDEETMPVVKPAESGMFVDERDGTEYGWVRIGNREWMTSNMRYEPETGLYGCYEEEGVLGEGSMSDNMFRKYGYYYNYAAAMTVAPQGWRLPTDADWADLERALGNRCDRRAGYVRRRVDAARRGRYRFEIGGRWLLFGTSCRL